MTMSGGQGDDFTPGPSLSQSNRTSGFEKAEKVFDGVDRVASGIGTFFTKVWGLILLAGGIAIIPLTGGSAWWVGLLVAAYGIYLLLPGSKWVIW